MKPVEVNITRAMRVANARERVKHAGVDVADAIRAAAAADAYAFATSLAIQHGIIQDDAFIICLKCLDHGLAADVAEAGARGQGIQECFVCWCERQDPDMIAAFGDLLRTLRSNQDAVDGNWQP